MDELTDAAADGHLHKLESFLQRPQDPDLVDHEGDTALFRASMQGHTDVVRLLLEARADVDKAPKVGGTPLFEASDFGHAETVRILLQARANVETVEVLSGCTAFLRASVHGHSEPLTPRRRMGHDTYVLAAGMTVAGALHEEAAKGGPSALLQLVKLVPDLSHGPLREAMANLVIKALLQCQADVQKCVKLLVEAVATTDQEPALCLNAVWALNEMAHTNPAAAGWIAQAGGVQALHKALVAYSSHKDHVDCCTWLMRTVAGPQGLILLLRSEQPNLPDSVVASVLRVIQKDSACWKDGQSQPIEEAPALVTAIAQHVAKLSPEHLYLAMSLWEDMAENPALSGKLLQLGGARLVTAALEVSVRAQDHKTAVSTCRTIVALTKAGRVNALQQLREQPNLLPGLEAAMQLGQGGRLEELAGQAWACLTALPEAIRLLEHPPRALGDRGMYGVLQAIKEMGTTEDVEEIRKLPQVLQELLKLNMKCGSAQQRPGFSVAALEAQGAVICSLAPRAKPNEVPALDESVRYFVSRLSQPVDFSGQEPYREVLEGVLDPLGKTALADSAWRDVLLKLGAKEATSARIRDLFGDRRMEKYCVWFLAALSGMPFVIKELQEHGNEESVVDAAFCAIIDILDDDVECEWLLNDHINSFSREDTPGLLDIVTRGMARHSEDSVIQSRGCHVLVLLLRLVQHLGELTQESILGMIHVLLGAYGSHYQHQGVVRDVSFLSRALLEPRLRSNDPEVPKEFQAQQLVAVHLRQAEIHQSLEKSIAYFGRYDDISRMPELFECTCASLALLSGAGRLLELLAELSDVPGRDMLRANALKALFELCRLRSDIIANEAQGAPGCRAVKAALCNLVGTSQDSQLRSAAVMLDGLCDALGRQAG